MDKSQLKELIREEIQNQLNEQDEEGPQLSQRDQVWVSNLEDKLEELLGNIENFFKQQKKTNKYSKQVVSSMEEVHSYLKEARFTLQDIY